MYFSTVIQTLLIPTFKSLCKGINTNIFHHTRPHEQEAYHIHWKSPESPALSQHWGSLLKHLLIRTDSLAPGSPKRKGVGANICGQGSSVTQSAKEKISVIAPHPGFLSKGNLEMFSLPFWISFRSLGAVGPPTEHKLQISKQLYLNSVKSIMQTTFFQ